jgi:hypothetical protein
VENNADCSCSERLKYIDTLQERVQNLCTVVRMLLASKHLKHNPDVVLRAKDYLTRIDGWGEVLRDVSGSVSQQVPYPSGLDPGVHCSHAAADEAQ